MRKLLILLIAISFSGYQTAEGQQSDPAIDLSLQMQFFKLQSAKEDSLRLAINDSIILLTGQLAGDHKQFNTKIPNLRNLGQIISPDSSLKILTWNLPLENGQGKYFCYVVRKNDTGASLNVRLLSHQYETGAIKTDTLYSENNWYGALYYDIRPFSYDGKKYWMLLGISYSDPYVIRKIIEVISYKSDDSLIFGAKWFDTGKAIRYRHVLEYSASAMITLRFMPDSSIVFDHLVALPRSSPDGRLEYGPDYSNDSFRFESGTWKLSVNVDARNPQK
jgi:hypothetical protein